MIIQADILTWAATYDGPKFHALLCDPPYHLTETTKRFGGEQAAPAQYGTDGAFQRAARGFMGRTWDGGAIAFRPETWAALAEHLYPGAFLFAFAGSRGYHRMACAIEDAGLIIHPAIGWAFGSGFPKATRIDTQVDRRAGAARSTVGKKKHAPKFAAKEFGYREKDNGYNSRERESFDVTVPATELAQAWQGHRYGGQVLKPAFEFICVAQKPYQGKPVECITATGAGALNIEAARVGTEKRVPGSLSTQNGGSMGHLSGLGVKQPEHSGQNPDIGRWPSNLVLSHSPSCNGTCAPGCPVAALGEQSGESTSGHRPGGGGKGGIWQTGMDSCVSPEHGDSGTAARFFFNADYLYERLEDADAVIYEAKASKGEREAGLDPRQLALLNMAEIEARDGASIGDHGRGNFTHGTINDGREKPIDNPYQRGETTRRNIHPTIKPIALARHLATLLLPPDAYAPRRLLIPFAGAGSEMVGAMLAGWDEVIGVELEADHVAIAQARLAYWRQRLHEYGDPAKEVRATLAEAPAGQLDMFEEQP